jgi:hypothetical protein
MDEIEDIWCRCPICGEFLDGFVHYIGTAKCPSGHYEYIGHGSYASEAVIRLNGCEERFWFDDGWGDEKKFDERMKQIRQEVKVDWNEQGF